MDDLRKPILPGKGASDYERYLRTDELLSLQKRPEEFLHPDEMTFQVVHQASELLLKGIAWELGRAHESSSRRATSRTPRGCCAAAIRCWNIPSPCCTFWKRSRPTTTT